MSSGATLQTRTIGEIVEDFWVPSYQRGYRWGPHEVTTLLDDVERSQGNPYYLQPVVVRARDDGRWELIDGQQRMTTIYLVLRHMERTSLQSVGPHFTLEYETRGDSRDYLHDPAPEHATDNVDFWHIHRADQSIAAWFDAKEHRKQVVANRLYEYLFESVRIIWYVAPSEVDEVDLFTRLNVGRIPLTNAELVKAKLLTDSRDRNKEVAAEWDSIERELRRPEVWAFASGRSDEVPTHISLVLDTLALTTCAACSAGAHGASGREKPVFHTFEVLRDRMDAEGWQAVWDDVVDLYSRLVGWFEDSDLFHRAGYLVATGTGLRDLVTLASGRERGSFDKILRGRIREQLSLTESELRSLDYENDTGTCERVLLLMNVETVRRRRESHERFPFAAHASQRWSLEHIHAQNSQELSTAEQWHTWLDLHARALAALPTSNDPTVATLIDDMAVPRDRINETTFRALAERVAPHFEDSGESGDDHVHSISNLALLSRDLNSALSNAVFEAKRTYVVNVDRTGQYIPPSTRNVFLKYYTDEAAQQVHFWGMHDREAYLSAMVESIRDYLLTEEPDHEH